MTYVPAVEAVAGLGPPSFNIANITFNTANLESDSEIAAGTSITVQDTGNVTIGSSSDLKATNIYITSTNGTVTATASAMTGTVHVIAASNALVDLGQSDSRRYHQAPNTQQSLVDPSGGYVYYAAASAQVYDGGGLIILGSGASAPAVTMGSAISGGSISGDLSISNSAGDLTIHFAIACVDGYRQCDDYQYWHKPHNHRWAGQPACGTREYHNQSIQVLLSLILRLNCLPVKARALCK